MHHESKKQSHPKFVRPGAAYSQDNDWPKRKKTEPLKIRAPWRGANAG
jgi:hypothetical protein